MRTIIVLITDRIYKKTRRHLKKIQQCDVEDAEIVLAIVDGFPKGLSSDTVADFNVRIIEGTVNRICTSIAELRSQDKIVRVVALNQSGILPALAVRILLELPNPSGYIESCDKRKTRTVLRERPELRLEHREVLPGDTLACDSAFASPRYVVKPAFGMSARNVKTFNFWKDVETYFRSELISEKWVPDHIVKVFNGEIDRTDVQIVEPFVEGTEFSIDGWRKGDEFFAVVQHKLGIIRSTFIGDGPTVSPPLKPSDLSDEWQGLKNSEETICCFGQRVLNAIGFLNGVFHIEGIERTEDSELVLIEINPRAPGGSLWKTVLYRTGFDLELIDAAIQLDLPLPQPVPPISEFVLHYPFYATSAGRLTDWGQLANYLEQGIHLQGIQSRTPDIEIDFAVELGKVFDRQDMCEEPYLAFSVATANSPGELLDKCRDILAMKPPSIVPLEDSSKATSVAD